MAGRSARPEQKRASADEKRNLRTGLRKLHQPVSDAAFDDLLAALSQAAKR